MNVAIVVPTYNESDRLLKTLIGVRKFFLGHIIVVDDGSTDSSISIVFKKLAFDKKLSVCRHIINLGKGAAMKTGAEIAWSMGCDSIIFMDADGQHNPKHIPDFMNHLKSSKLVFGYRELNKDMPLVRKLGNIFAGRLVKLLFNIQRKDLLCGYLAINKDIYPKIIWFSSRYGIETEMATRVARNNLSFIQIKVDTIYVDKYKGVTLIDAFKILMQIPVWYFSI